MTGRLLMKPVEKALEKSPMDGQAGICHVVSSHALSELAPTNTEN